MLSTGVRLSVRQSRRSIVSRCLPYTIRCGSPTRLVECSHTLARSFTVTVAVVYAEYPPSTETIDVARGRHGPGHLLLRLTYTPTGISYRLSGPQRVDFGRETSVFTDIDAMHKRGLRCRPVSVCPSVCHVGELYLARTADLVRGF